jgi:hypothetical protein
VGGQSVRPGLYHFAIIGLAFAAPAHSAETWQEYTYPEAGFSASFPGKPVFAEQLYRTSQSPSGAVTERIYSFNQGGVIYSVSIADFSKVDADPDIVVDEVASVLMGLGTVAFYGSIYLDSMHGRELVVIGGDGTRYTDANFYVKQLLYQVRVVYPAVNSDPAGSSGISIFQAKFHFTDPF